MIPIRNSSALRANERLDRVEKARRISNLEWLQEVDAREGIVLIGGAGLSDFRLRFAQSGARSDLTPSHWSMAGIVLDQERFLSVPLDGWREATAVAVSNGIRECAFSDYEDAGLYPNISLLSFGADSSRIVGIAEELMIQRSIVDLPEMMLPWLAWLWDAGQAANPLAAAVGVPSAAFVEVVYGAAGIEVTPGLSSASSCPEAIWQSAKWWHEFYLEAARPSRDSELSDDQARAREASVPSGHALIRQPIAALGTATGEPAATRTTDGARFAAMQAARAGRREPPSGRRRQSASRRKPRRSS